MVSVTTRIASPQEKCRPMSNPLHLLLCLGGVMTALPFLGFSQTARHPFDWQGHRGARGLAPENTVSAFLQALSYPWVTTLEMDLAVSKDGFLVVSHEPWMSDAICLQPDGSPVPAGSADSHKLMDLTYQEIQAYDCGSRGNPRFPAQRQEAAHKPSLNTVVDSVRKYCREHDRPLPAFNIEIKSQPSYDGVYTPPVAEFARLTVATLHDLGIDRRSTVQSFDPRALRAVHELDPTQATALLVEKPGDPGTFLAQLGFQPTVYSPYHRLLRKRQIDHLHQIGIRVIPWTVNDTKAMRKLIRRGVDGIITDYPDRAWPVR
ncbi:MAG: hypothetical protein RLY31_2746 [Bacteroidota bacterium]|jgi:glycerophosphoryl diester phosphodiesterase